MSTRCIEGLVETLWVTSQSNSQVKEMANSFDDKMVGYRSRLLNAGPHRYVRANSLTTDISAGGSIANIACPRAIDVTVEGHRAILRVDLATAEGSAGWLAFFRSLVARGVLGAQLVISDEDHPGFVYTTAATLPGVSWQRRRTHYPRNPLMKVPKSSASMVATMMHAIFALPDPDRVGGQHSRTADHLDDVGFVDAAVHVDQAGSDILALTGLAKVHWRQIRSNNR